MIAEKTRTYHFLEGGGEMGELTRSFDWSQTSVGSFDHWPQSLRTTVGIILHSDFPMFLWWGDEMIQFYNDAYRPSLGQTGKHPDALGQRAEECWPEIWSIIYPLIQQVRNTGKSFFSEDQLVPIFRNGKIEDVYWTFSYSAVIGETGNVDGVLVVCTETTKKVLTLEQIKSARKQLEESENNLRNIILHSPVAMCFLKGPQYVVDIANERMFELWGKQGGQVLNKPIFEELAEVKDQGFEELLNIVYTTGNSFSAFGLPTILPRNGKMETIYLNFVYEAFKNGNGEIYGIMAVATDVTEQIIARNKTEKMVAERTRELAVANENLKKSNAELSQFAYITSHDLQEPARKISTFVDMLNNSLDDSVNARARNYLKKIEDASERMLTLIRDVLALSQLTNVKQLIEKVDLNLILESVKNDFDLLIEQKGCTISNNTLPVVEANAVQMSQLFRNLISNSLKFTSKEKKPLISITSTEMLQDELQKRGLNPDIPHYKISFADNGIGFHQANAKQIFDIFKRLHSKSEFEGTGIGLAMCKKIAQNHYGDIYAEAALGKGASFHVILPQHQST